MRDSSLPDSIGAIPVRAARRWGDKPALLFEGCSFSHAQVDAASSAVAAALLAEGIVRGDRVSLYSPNCPEWIFAYYGILKAGAVVNPLNLMLTAEEAAFAMADCGARAVIGSAERIGNLAAMRSRTRLELLVSYGGPAPEGAIDFERWTDVSGHTGAAAHFPVEGLAPDQPGTIAYTSGTTGQPKGAVLSHRAVLMNTAMTATMHLRGAHDVVATALPCSHVYGNVVMNGTLAWGGTLVLHRSFDAARMLESIERHRCTLFEGVPTMYLYLLDSPALGRHDLGSLTRCTVGGQTMPEAKMRAVEAALQCPLLELWGMTELAGLGTTHSLYGPRRLGSIGVPLPHLEARIASATDGHTVLPAGEIGELQIRGPVVMQEYLGRPDATAETMSADGWLRSGDLARMDAEGFLYVVDRLKDMINTGGFKVYPAELERVLSAHPDVAMVAVAGIPDPLKGELAKAFVVPRAGCTPSADALERYCREHLAAYKVPRAFQFLDDLPKTSTGKILRRKLRDLPS